MQRLQRTADAPDHRRRLALYDSAHRLVSTREAPLVHQPVVEVTAAHVLHHHVHQQRILVYVDHAHDAVVVHAVLDLAQHRQLLPQDRVVDVPAGNHLHGVHLARLLAITHSELNHLVLAQTHHAVAPLAQHVEQTHGLVDGGGGFALRRQSALQRDEQ